MLNLVNSKLLKIVQVPVRRPNVIFNLISNEHTITSFLIKVLHCCDVEVDEF